MSIRLKIKPCPFCGGKAKIYWNHVWDYGFIKCDTCGATTGKFDVEREGRKAWNKRTQPTFTPDELAEIYRMFDLSIHQIPISHYAEIRKSIVDKCDFALKGTRENAT